MRFVLLETHCPLVQVLQNAMFKIDFAFQSWEVSHSYNNLRLKVFAVLHECEWMTE